MSSVLDISREKKDILSCIRRFIAGMSRRFAISSSSTFSSSVLHHRENKKIRRYFLYVHPPPSAKFALAHRFCIFSLHTFAFGTHSATSRIPTNYSVDSWVRLAEKLLSIFTRNVKVNSVAKSVAKRGIPCHVTEFSQISMHHCLCLSHQTRSNERFPDWHTYGSLNRHLQCEKRVSCMCTNVSKITG